MSRKRVLLYWIGGGLLVFTLFGFFLAPRFLKSFLVKRLNTTLHRETTIRKVRLNPYALSLTIDGLRINEPNSTNTFVRWERLYVNLQLVSVIQRALVFRTIILSNAYAHVALGGDHTFNFTDLIPPAAAPTEPASAPPTIRIGELDIRNAQVVYHDASRPTPFATTIGPITVRLERFSTQSDNQNPYSFTAVTDAGESVAWSGSFYMNPVRSAGEFNIDRVVLARYAPYYDQFPNLRVHDGLVGIRGDYRVDLSTEPPVAIVSNAVVRLHSFRLAERNATNDAIAQSTLTISEVFLDVFQRRIEVGSVAGQGGKIRVAILPGAAENDDQPTPRSINVLNLFATLPTTTTNRATVSTTNGTATVVLVHRVEFADSTVELSGVLGNQSFHWDNMQITNVNVRTEPLAATVDRVTLTNAALTHADSSVAPSAHVTVQQINGVIDGISLDPDAETTFRVTAKVNNVSPVEISGTLTPMSLRTADVKILFRDVSLLPADPYAGKFLGYKLASGSLNLELQYSIAARQLESRNTIVLNQVALGDATGSSDAIQLPFKLGLAVLKDRNGVIKLDVPISGSFDDPQFRLRPVIFKTFQNLFVRVLTSPFSVLGSMFGGGGDDLSFQEFVPGQAELQPHEALKLDTLLRALQERPGLSVLIRGTVDHTQDRDRLRRAKLDELLAAASLRDVYLAHLEELQATIVATNTPPAAPAGFSNISGVTPKNLPRDVSPVPTVRSAVAEMAPEEMDRQLLEVMDVTADDFERLATDRAAAVRDYLLQSGGIESNRVTVATESAKKPLPDAPRAVLQLQ